MSVIFVEGWDKYGPAGQTTPTVASLLTAGEWTTAVANPAFAIVAPLSSSGQALNINAASSGGGAISRTLAANYGRIIGGCRFASTLGNRAGVEFRDGTSPQFAINVNQTTGTISIISGAGLGTTPGTTIATSAATVTANSTHYLEWDVTIGTAGAYQVWLDGASILSGTGNTRAGTSNNYINAFLPHAGSGSGGVANITVDDIYLFDSTGTTCNAPLLNNPVVETAFPSGDSLKQWTNAATIIGPGSSSGSTSLSTTGRLYVRSHTATASMSLQSITIMPNTTNAGVSHRPVVYASTATGAALLATGPTVVGTTSGAALTMPLTAPLSLTGGTTYAIGFMTDTGISMLTADGSNGTSSGTVTFASGAPSTLPTMTTNVSAYWCWGNCTGSASDYVCLNINPPPDDSSYLYSGTVGQQEMQSFPALASTPTSVACVAYKARVKRSDSGARTVEVHCASGAADTAGSTAGGITTGTSYSWLPIYLPTDPATGVAWGGTGINAARGGVRVAS